MSYKELGKEYRNLKILERVIGANIEYDEIHDFSFKESDTIVRLKALIDPYFGIEQNFRKILGFKSLRDLHIYWQYISPTDFCTLTQLYHLLDVSLFIKGSHEEAENKNLIEAPRFKSIKYLTLRYDCDVKEDA